MLAGAGFLGGADFLAWMVLALGAAMAVGNLIALVRPPAARRDDSDLDRPPLVRSLIFIGIGAVAAVWALLTLVAG